MTIHNPVWQELVPMWQHTKGHPEIRIAVIDGPIDQQQSCFQGSRLKVITEIVSDAPQNSFSSHHGTHVASILFGQHHSPIKGIAPDCTGIIIPIFSDDEQGNFKPASQIQLAQAIRIAIREKAHIINISAGELSSDGEPITELKEAIEECKAKNILLVAAAGNNGCACIHIPAASPYALSVGALDQNGAPLESSNWGAPYQLQGIVTYGAKIPVAQFGGEISTARGTSYATPIISGIAGLLLSWYLRKGTPRTPYQIKDILRTHTTPCDLTLTNNCEKFLGGKLDIKALLKTLNIHQSFINKPKIQLNMNNDYPTQAEAEAMDQQELVLSADTASDNELEQPPMTNTSNEEAPALNEDLSEIAPQGELDLSACACQDKEGSTNAAPSQSKQNTPPALAYVLGKIGYTFANESRRDSFLQEMRGNNPHDHASLIAHLKDNPFNASSVIWTLNIDDFPVYAIHPEGAYARDGYDRLREFLNAQIEEGVERVSIPGRVKGFTTLLSGQKVPVIVPELRGMYSWDTVGLVQAVVGEEPKGKDEKDRYENNQVRMFNFLERVYYEIRNKGITPQQRALNYAATNAFQAQQVFEQAAKEELELANISVAKSPVNAPGADLWDVQLSFFNPKKRHEVARKVYRFSVDVSDVVPVTTGPIRNWSEY
ncbi:hypothetical protein BKI52_11570 [marine bacterium AO1-C]|nr:hypothetical protein BKI52_11570 [marine bacterium AO1-C]